MSGGECNNLKYYAKLAESGEWFEVGEPVEIEMSESEEPQVEKLLKGFSGTLTFTLYWGNNRRRMNSKRPLRWRTIERWILKHT